MDIKEIKEDIKYWIDDFYRSKIRRPYFFFHYGISNLWKWFPAVWKDRQWDYNYFFDILKFKLQLMEHFERNYSIVLGSEKQADRIRVCINLIDRINKMEYADNLHEKFSEKWGDLVFGSGGVRFENETKENKEELRKEMFKINDYETKQFNRDMEYLFYLIKKHSIHWGD